MGKMVEHSMTGKLLPKTSRVVSRRTALRAGVGAGIALGARSRPARAATEKVIFQLDWIPFGRHAPYYAALENGFYAQKGLDVTILQGRSTIEGLRSLIAKQSHFTFQDIAIMMTVRASEGTKIKALACMYQRNPHTLFYIKGNGIEHPKDIERKKVAFTPGDSPRRMFPAFARANGVDDKKISWLSVDPSSKNAVLLNHQTEGMVTYLFTKPVLQKAAQNGDQVGSFTYSDYGADFYSNGIGALEEYITEKPDVVRSFVQATMQGLKFSLEHPKDAVTMLKKHQPQLDEDVALQEIDILRVLTNAQDIQLPGSMTREKMVITQDLLVKYLDMTPTENIDNLYTNKFLA
jgi:NitT/TauT family transport system substrate-binding protein